MVNKNVPRNSDSAPAPKIVLRLVFLKSVVFDAPEIRSMDDLTVDLENVQVIKRTNIVATGKNVYELTMGVDVTVTKAGQQICRASVEEVGVFRVPGLTEDEAFPLLRAKGAALVYPFVREFMMSMFSRSGLPQLAMAPLDEEAFSAN